MTTPASQPELHISQPSGDTLVAELTGNWTLAQTLPPFESLEQKLASVPALKQISFETERLTAWDTGALTYLAELVKLCNSKNIEVDKAGLPDGLQRLLNLAFAVPPREGAERSTRRESVITQAGKMAMELLKGAPETVQFLGEATLSFMRFLIGRAQFRTSDLFVIIQETGPQALPIVTLISFLVGVILAYMGAVQLEQFGAQVFVANLVGLGMAREMAAIMTGIIMAGRSGASFAAQLGTMQVNEEIDALRTLGVNPMDFLVLPRMLALILMVPLLTLYSGAVGILAGMFVSVTLLDISGPEYWNQTVRALNLQHFASGLLKAAIYGVLIAIAGCMRGMQCGRSAQAVGEATTSAVVTSIVYMVVAAAILTVVYQQIGF
ncbi:MAG: ABC transporter permease [Chromatiales bacterium]